MGDLPRFLVSEEGLFHGSNEFYERLESGRLRPGQGFRTYDYGRMAGDELRFGLGLEGELYNQEQKKVDPMEVLSGEDGWEFNGMGLECLPDEISLKLPR